MSLTQSPVELCGPWIVTNDPYEEYLLSGDDVAGP